MVVMLLCSPLFSRTLPDQKDPLLIHDDANGAAALHNLSPSEEFWFGTNSIGQ